MKSGQDVEAKIIEMDGEKIRYKKFNYQDGMDLILSLSKVASITYGNGETENFDVPEPAPAIQTIPAPTNSEQTSVELSAPASEVTAPVEQASTTEQMAPETVPVAEPKPNEVAPAAVAAPASVVQQVTGPSPADANAVPQKPLYYENSAGNEYVVVKKRKKIPPMENPESVWYQAPNNGFSIWFQPLGLVMWGPVVGFSVRHKTAFMIDGYVRLPKDSASAVISIWTWDLKWVSFMYPLKIGDILIRNTPTIHLLMIEHMMVSLRFSDSSSFRLA